MEKHIVRNVADGSIDMAASVNSFAAYVAELAAREPSTQDIQNAVDNAFNNLTGEATRMTLPILVSHVAGALGQAFASDFSKVDARVRAFIKGSPRFKSHKGANGGVERLAKNVPTVNVEPGDLLGRVESV